MDDYNYFIDRYKDKIHCELSYDNYIRLVTSLSDTLDVLQGFNGTNIKDKHALTEFAILCLINKYSIDEILSGKCDNELEKIIKYVEEKNNSKIETPKVKIESRELDVEKLIYSDLKEMKAIFADDMDLYQLAKDIKETLQMEGYTNYDIQNGKTYEKIIEYISGGYLGIRFSNEYKEMKSVVSSKVERVFLPHRKEVMYKNNCSLECQYFTNRKYEDKIIFALCVDYMSENIDPESIINDTSITRHIENIIRRDMIRINSTAHKEPNIIEKYKAMSYEERLERREWIKRAIIISLIILGLLAPENIIYKKKQERKRLEESKPKSSYSFKNTAYNIDEMVDKAIELNYYPEANEFELGGDNLVQM